MAAEEADEDEGEEGGKKKSRKLPDPKLVMVLLNSVLTLGTLGLFVYTKLMWQKPEITEDTEIQKKQEELKSPPPLTEPLLIKFDQLMINIAMTSGKSHYATVAFAVEARDSDVAAIVRTRKALFLDKVIASLGRRQMTELNTIQGKLLLKIELMRDFNGLTMPGGITDLYFSAFILQ